MIEDELLKANERMRKAIESIDKELSTVRTGRARPNLVENIRVDCYGVPTPLNQLANISAPDARLLIIQPWDRNILPNIEKAIHKSDLGLNPSNDGRIIRLAIPQLTEERRKELVKAVHKRVEEGRVALRNIRRDTVEQLRKMEREKEISEDENKRAQEQLQKLVDGCIGDVERLSKDKEAELMEI